MPEHPEPRQRRCSRCGTVYEVVRMGRRGLCSPRCRMQDTRERQRAKAGRFQRLVDGGGKGRAGHDHVPWPSGSTHARKYPAQRG